MKKMYKGSFTVEAAVVVPIILFVFVALIHILFYYHDKNVLMGIAHETASFGSGREQLADTDLEQYFDEKVKGKLLAFSNIEKKIQINDKQVVVSCKATGGPMKIHVEFKMSRTNPENYIRNIRKLEKGERN